MSEPADEYREYVVGFIFSKDWQSIALLRKQPRHSSQQWQAGKLNGVGGKVEPSDEDYAHAMRREGNEETNSVHIWEYKGTVMGKGWALGVYCTTYDLSLLPKANDVGEEFVICSLDTVFENDIVENLRYLIPLCQDMNINFTILDTWVNPND